jgi:hypothetical protein
VAGARRAEEGAAAITAEGDEVEIAASVEALQGVAHGKVWDNAKSKTAPLKGTRDAAPTSFSVAVYIEIVKPRLPKRPQRFSTLLERQPHLPARRTLPPLAHFSRHAQLEFQEHGGRCPALRLAHQQMHDISDQSKIHFIANFREFPYKYVARSSATATAGNN